MDVVVKRLDRELKLDEEQKRKLQGIMDDARIQLRQSHAKIRPEVEQTLREAEGRTRAILYPAQVRKFDDMVKKSREKWQAMEAPNATTPPATPPPAATPTPTTPAPAPAEDPK
jgi:3-phenylpropionate/cinnamic acid dioxygenase small subunit